MPHLHGPLFLVHLFVNDTGRRRHPLDIARSDHASVTCRIPMSHGTLIHYRYSFKSAMRVFPDLARLIGSGETLWSCIVQHEEWVNLSLKIVAWEQIPNRKPVTDHMR
jgi:hypothetical protein